MRNCVQKGTGEFTFLDYEIRGGNQKKTKHGTEIPCFAISPEEPVER